MQPDDSPRTGAALAPTFPAVIEAIEVIEVCVPKRERNRINAQYGTIPDSRYPLVLVKAGGLTGVGEASTEQWWTGEDAASVRHVVQQFLAPELVGRSLGIREALDRMQATIVGHPYAKAAIEIALWDLLGKATGQPLRVLLGGNADPDVKIPIKYVIGIGDEDHIAAEIEFGREHGFSHFKTKVGADLDDDLARVAAIAKRLTSGETIGVDANAGWSAVDAIQALGPLQELGVHFLEQPVPPSQPAAMAALTARSSIPIVAHETIFTVDDGLRAATEGLAHIWALTPSTHGGIWPTVDLLAIARTAGIPCLLGSNIELDVSTAMMAQIAAAFPEIRNCPVASDIIGPLYHEDTIAVNQPRIADGFVEVPAGPGLGIQLDWDKVSFYQQ
jgi:L-alanine-DL-glutamate epimerase-like enolase superfamily enzyme